MRNREHYERRSDIDELYARGNKPAPPASQKYNIVYVNATGTPPAPGVPTFASPYTAKPFDKVICDTSAEDIVINLPTLALGEFVGVADDSATGSGGLMAHTITVSSGGQDMDQPPPNNGTFVGSFVFGPGTTYWLASGQDYTWYNGGSSGGLLLE